ncbi:MAG TPA: nucleotidyltransferase family protein [Pyrinomonadaceae bacterium]|nr:nucleotidyltransferase family protein [Pyrinomonadaceae bacterium]
MKKSPPNRTRGHLVREALTGAWREEPARAALTAEELAEVTPLLLGSGAAGLAWWRIRHTQLRFTNEAEELERAYQLNVIRASLQERQLEEVFRLLTSARVDALLIKGWAAGRSYPAKGLRPSGDLDLVVRPGQMDEALTLFGAPEAKQFFVDFEHEELEALSAGEWDELFARSREVAVGGGRVRLMSEEDHLRFLSVHLLRHGAWRPLWLADVAAALETRAESFDWERCLGSDPLRAGWVACALGLAERLLGARIDDPAIAARARRLPKWMVSSVLKQWERPCVMDRLPPELMAETLRKRPIRIFGALLKRWPDPLQATIRMRAPVNRLPRFPFQMGEYVVRTASYMTRRPKLRRGQ